MAAKATRTEQWVRFTPDGETVDVDIEVNDDKETVTLNTFAFQTIASRAGLSQRSATAEDQEPTETA